MRATPSTAGSSSSRSAPMKTAKPSPVRRRAGRRGARVSAARTIGGTGPRATAARRGDRHGRRDTAGQQPHPGRCRCVPESLWREYCYRGAISAGDQDANAWPSSGPPKGCRRQAHRKWEPTYGSPDPNNTEHNRTCSTLFGRCYRTPEPNVNTNNTLKVVRLLGLFVVHRTLHGGGVENLPGYGPNLCRRHAQVFFVNLIWGETAFRCAQNGTDALTGSLRRRRSILAPPRSGGARERDA